MKTHVGSVPSQSRRLGRTRANACCCFGGCHGGRFDWVARLRPSAAAVAAPARHQRIRAQQGYQEAGPLPFQQPRRRGQGLPHLPCQRQTALGRPSDGSPSLILRAPAAHFTDTRPRTRGVTERGQLMSRTAIRRRQPAPRLQWGCAAGRRRALRPPAAAASAARCRPAYLECARGGMPCVRGFGCPS